MSDPRRWTWSEGDIVIEPAEENNSKPKPDKKPDAVKPDKPPQKND